MRTSIPSNTLRQQRFAPFDDVDPKQREVSGRRASVMARHPSQVRVWVSGLLVAQAGGIARCGLRPQAVVG
jgi:hypothetical protein